MSIKKKYTLEFIKENNLILLDAISGSHAYGTSTPQSDIDHRGIFIMALDDYLSLDYVEQVNDEKNDVVYYEIGKFIQLLLTNNPNILELLNVPEDCLKYRHSLMDLINQTDFISKLCAKAFGGYANEQIKKARGLNKKIVNPVEKEKKTPIDFCYVIQDEGSKPLSIFLQEKNMEQKFCGLVNVPHAKDVYTLFYDQVAHNCFSESVPFVQRESTKESCQEQDVSFGFGYKGVEMDDSNTIRVSSIPKGEMPVCTLSYNKDGYTTYCKDYKDYWDWEEKKNKERFSLSTKQGYDQKNMMHCFRLTEMSKEIASGQGIIVRRPNREFLMTIRNGQMEYSELVDMAEKNLKEADVLFKTSNLMDQPDPVFANELLINIRKKFYELI